MAVESPTPKANGLKTVWDTIVAPKAAFESIQASPGWGTPFLIAVVLMAIGYFLQHAAQVHASIGTMQHMIATNSFFSGLPESKKQEMLDNAAHPDVKSQVIGLLFLPVTLLFAALFNSLFLLLANAIGSGTGKFRQFFAASMDIAVPSFGLGSLILGLITILRGPDSFNSTIDLLTALPGLGMLAGGSTGFMAAFLGYISIFSLWGCILNALFLRSLRVNAAVAWAIPVLVLLLGAAFGAKLNTLFG
jgi:hypothetical protein